MIPRPRREAVFVFGVAIFLAVVIGIGLGGVGQRPSALRLAGSASTAPPTAFVANVPSDTQPVTGMRPHRAAASAARHARRDSHSAAKRAAAQRAAARRAAAQRAAAKRAAAKRAAAKRRAARRKAATARTRQQSRKSHPALRTVVVRTRSVAPTRRTTAARPAPTTRTTPVRSAPKTQPAPAVQFNETGTSPSSGGGTVQFDQSGSGTTPTP
jgi:hypothetical protein